MNELHGSGTASSVGGAQGVGLSTWGPSPPSLWGILIGVFAGIALGGLFGQTLWHARGGPGQRQARLEAELRRVESFLQSTVPTDAARRQQA
ncbi:MAG: hypothetical protein NZ899_15300, partial [Thermoguttaceae bacterium]|nr:hypothetical protein [Thermoguttaceae bacterium]